MDANLYDEILKSYERLRMMRKRERLQRLKEVYAKDSVIEELDIKIQNTGAAAMMEILEKPTESKTISANMQKEIALLSKQRTERVLALGYSQDYTDMEYDCALCEDTGYVNGNICECLQLRATKAAKAKSDIAPLLHKQNFEKFDLSIFDEKNHTLVQENLTLAKEFVKNFGKENVSLLLYGDAGCGKTFLSSCIAHALLEKNVQVVYKSAVRLFADYLDYVFNRADMKEELLRVMDAQLLIIDDLGTEAVNQHTVSYLFQLINERAMRGKSTIISTNLSLKEIESIYSARISSRLFERYELVEFPLEDLRAKIKTRLLKKIPNESFKKI